MEIKSIAYYKKEKILVVCLGVIKVSDISRIIGERIRMYRTRKHLSQDKLGELAELNGAYIGQLERGERNATLVSVEKVARALDVPFEVLFENIVGGGTQNEIPKACYDLLTPLPVKEQKAIFELVKKAMEYKNV